MAALAPAWSDPRHIADASWQRRGASGQESSAGSGCPADQGFWAAYHFRAATIPGSARRGHHALPLGLDGRRKRARSTADPLPLPQAEPRRDAVPRADRPAALPQCVLARPEAARGVPQRGPPDQRVVAAALGPTGQWAACMPAAAGPRRRWLARAGRSRRPSVGQVAAVLHRPQLPVIREVNLVRRPPKSQSRRASSAPTRHSSDSAPAAEPEETLTDVKRPPKAGCALRKRMSLHRAATTGRLTRPRSRAHGSPPYC